LTAITRADGAERLLPSADRISPQQLATTNYRTGGDTVTLSLTTADLIADLEESPGVAAMSQLDPIDHLWLEWVGKGFTVEEPYRSAKVANPL